METDKEDIDWVLQVGAGILFQKEYDKRLSELQALLDASR